jgi:hypothetical protein
MATDPSELVSIKVPEVSGEEVLAASDLVEQLVEKYKISAVDTDALFNAMVSIFVRDRIVYGDRKPNVCSLSCNLDSDPKN